MSWSHNWFCFREFALGGGLGGGKGGVGACESVEGHTMHEGVRMESVVAGRLG